MVFDGIAPLVNYLQKIPGPQKGPSVKELKSLGSNGHSPLTTYMALASVSCCPSRSNYLTFTYGIFFLGNLRFCHTMKDPGSVAAHVGIVAAHSNSLNPCFSILISVTPTP